MIETPITLNSLDDNHAFFVGVAEESVTHYHPLGFGSVEVDHQYPTVIIQREMWELYGRPTKLTLKLVIQEPLPSRYDDV